MFFRRKTKNKAKASGSGNVMVANGSGNVQVISSPGKGSHGSRARKVSVNGKTFEVNGNNIAVVNGRVFVDGKEITDEDAK